MLQTVAAVQTLADAVLAERGLQGPARAYVEKIVSQAEFLADTVRQELRQADGQKGRRLIDLRRLISDVADGERVTYQGVLKVIEQPVPVLIHTERSDLRRVISNLLSNATRAAGPAGNVVIDVEMKSGLAEIVIDNTGPALAEVQEGTGLGWSIIAQRLSRIEGKLAYDQGSRGGVRATLSLPLAVC
jgi:signal transduction histidine kinase